MIASPAMRTSTPLPALALVLALAPALLGLGCAEDPVRCTPRTAGYTYCRGSDRTDVETGDDPTILHVEEVTDGTVVRCPAGASGPVEVEEVEDCAANGQVCVETLTSAHGTKAECRDPG